MKAAIIEKYGSPDHFKVKNIPSPSIKEGQILVRNKASSVNPVDTIVREGKLKLVTGLFGDHIIGSDFCGTVIASKSNLYKEGEEVFGFISALTGGAYAEEIVVDEDQVAPKPARISFAEAASLPLVASTALQGLLNVGKLKAGDHVLVNGCTGGVGSAAVQIAKDFGATVTGVCSGRHVDFARALGCDFVIDYENEKIPDDRRFDLFFDAAGKSTYSGIKTSLKASGVFVTTRGGVKNFLDTIETAVDVLKRKTKFVLVQPNTKDLIRIRNLVESHKLRPFVAKTFPLDKIDQAHIMLEKESFIGKIAVSIDGQ